MSYPKIVVTPPGPKAKKAVARDARYISPSFGRAYPLVVKEAKGCIVTDVDGNQFIDMNSGLAVMSVGHSHPKVLKAIHEQVDNEHFSSRGFNHAHLHVAHPAAVAGGIGGGDLHLGEPEAVEGDEDDAQNQRTGADAEDGARRGG